MIHDGEQVIFVAAILQKRYQEKRMVMRRNEIYV